MFGTAGNTMREQAAGGASSGGKGGLFFVADRGRQMSQGGATPDRTERQAAAATRTHQQDLGPYGAAQTPVAGSPRQTARNLSGELDASAERHAAARRHSAAHEVSHCAHCRQADQLTTTQAELIENMRAQLAEARAELAAAQRAGFDLRSLGGVAAAAAEGVPPRAAAAAFAPPQGAVLAISDADIADVNGFFAETGMENHKPVFSKIGVTGVSGGGGVRIFWSSYDTKWKIEARRVGAASERSCYWAADRGETPPADRWRGYGAGSPRPGLGTSWGHGAPPAPVLSWIGGEPEPASLPLSPR